MAGNDQSATHLDTQFLDCGGNLEKGWVKDFIIDRAKTRVEVEAQFDRLSGELLKLEKLNKEI